MARVKISDTKAYQIDGINVNGVPMIAIRQMYTTRKEPGVFKPGKGVTLPHSDLQRIVKAMRHVHDQDTDTYPEISSGGK